MPLNLPAHPFRIKKVGGKAMIFDRLRKRYVALTPEEWVRQHFVEYLIAEKGFPPALMANEVSLTQNGIRRRCDTLVADREGRPLAIIEYKAPGIALTQHTFDQIVRYNLVLRARYLMVSNGVRHYCCRIDYATGGYAFIDDIPAYTQLKDC